ncbi:MAG TPA: GNAT family N-acetyltransferase [Gammaproteobacteria bacterium]|jgi:ribosomal protein S18 acetylase RimI-like enzyme|nr:GNAT family N-acetyltransferase [Gammaproteobacteria bacterium]
MMVLIRTFESVEWRKYRAVRLQALQDSPDAFGSTYIESVKYPDEQWLSRLESINPVSDLPLGAFVSDMAVGLAWGRIEPDHPGRADLYQMWTSPEYRGQGIGKKLLTESISWARQQQARDLYLGVTMGNSMAAQLYVNAGFESVGEPELLRPGSDKLIQNMRLGL